MKKMGLVLMGLVAGASAQANMKECMGRPCNGPELSTIAIIQLPTIMTRATTWGIEQNDILQIQDDAMIALDTGVMSVELRSVVDKIRSEYEEETKDISDIEVIEMVFGEI